MSVVLTYTLTPEGRVSAGSSGQVQNQRSIHDVLPGSVVRGALGSVWWMAPPVGLPSGDRDLFDAVFGGSMRVGFAIPAVQCKRPVSAELQAMSWGRCKYRTADDCPAGWVDRALEPSTTCPGCGAPWQGGKGWSVPREWTVATTRTALTPRGTAKDAQLFTREALRREVILAGVVELDGLSEADSRIVEQWLCTPRRLSVGGQRSTLGRVTWTCERSEAPAVAADARHVVRLTTPAILVDGYGAASIDLAGAVRQRIELVGGSGQVGRSWVRSGTLSGWHGIAGIPKSEEWIVEAGSTVVVDGCDDAALSALARGIGLRQREGYGALAVLTRHQAAELILTANGNPHDDHDDACRGSGDPAPALPSGPVEALLDLLPDEGRAATLRAVLQAARNSLRTRNDGLPAVILDTRVTAAMSQPWARDLGWDARRAAEAILRHDGVAALIDALVVAERESR